MVFNRSLLLVIQSMEVIGEGIRNSGRFPNVVVPRPIPGLCTDEIVVMTRLRGQKLFSRVLEHYETFAKEIGMTLEQLKEEMTAKFKSGDAQPASWRTMLSQPKLLWALARTWWFEAVGWWLPTFLTNIVRTVKLEPRISYPPAPLPTNHMALFDTVARVHGFQVLSLGEFNGDAHAGNIFLLDDGKIGLLDFGATRTLNEEERLNLASNIHLLTEPVLDVKRIAERTKALGFVSEKQLDYTAYMWAIILFHRDDPSVLVGKDGEKFADMGTFQQYLMNVDKTVQFPEQFFLAARLALLLRGLALLLGLGGVSVAEFWKDEATRAQALLGKDSSRS